MKTPCPCAAAGGVPAKARQHHRFPSAPCGHSHLYRARMLARVQVQEVDPHPPPATRRHCRRAFHHGYGDACRNVLVRSDFERKYRRCPSGFRDALSRRPLNRPAPGSPFRAYAGRAGVFCVYRGRIPLEAACRPCEVCSRRFPPRRARDGRTPCVRYSHPRQARKVHKLKQAYHCDRRRPSQKIVRECCNVGSG